MRDFENWYNYYVTNFGPVDRELAEKAYSKYFTCTCEICAYRKERGFTPVRLNLTNCTAPESPEGLIDVVKRLLAETQKSN